MDAVKKTIPVTIFLGLIALGTIHAQSPSGAIAGRVTDPTGAVIPGARIVVSNMDTRLKRALETTAEGDYSAPALPAGVYEVAALAPGFQQLLRGAIVEAGSTTTVNLAMQVGPAAESVTVESASPQIRYDTHEVGGVVTRLQIESLPLNGRSYLELAKLEPGAQQPTLASNNRTLVPLLGAPVGQNGRATRVTVDGGSVALAPVNSALRVAGSADLRLAQVAGPLIAPTAWGNARADNQQAAGYFRQPHV